MASIDLSVDYAPEPALSRRGLWPGWMLANAIGLVAGGLVFVAVAVIATVSGLDQDDGGRQPVFGAVLGGTFGLALAVSQGWVLQRRIRRPRAWAVATGLGVAAGVTLVFGVLADGSGIPSEVQVALHPLVLALAAGAPQAYVLRGEIQRAWRWVLISLVAWGAGAALALAVPIDGLNLLVLAATAVILQGAALALLAPVEDDFPALR
jgi:hypothetical protein